MSSPVKARQHVFVADETRTEAQEIIKTEGLSVELRDGSGNRIEVPSHVEQALLRTLNGLANSGKVEVSTFPDELTTTQAAELLGISRSLLMIMVRQNEVPFYKVGSHHRFNKAELIEHQRRRREEQLKAYWELKQHLLETYDEYDDEGPVG